MKRWLAALAVSLPLASLSAAAEDLSQKRWIHGSEDCATNRDPAIEVFRFDEATYVLRQSKCVHFEAPFIYVLFGAHTVFVQDTGATEDAAQFPLYDTLQSLITQRTPRAATRPRVLVTHSHGHDDHTAGDPQFRGKPGVTLIEPDPVAVRSYFKLSDWPNGTTTIDLGGRELIVIPIPGHQDAHVAVYDSRTKWLLSGDSLYPGALYVMDWAAYRSSVHRLVEFSQTHSISAVMGTHIEMSRAPGKLYARGTTFQPDEAGLALSVADLRRLDGALQRAGGEPREIPTGKFVVSPVSAFTRALGRFLHWIGVI